jgi:hypothetical protein
MRDGENAGGRLKCEATIRARRPEAIHGLADAGSAKFYEAESVLGIRVVFWC